MILGPDLPWRRLDWHVQHIFGKYPEILEAIEQNPIDESFIDGLVSDGWRVEFSELPEETDGIYSLKKKKISIDNCLIELDYYERDKTFFHELAHLRHLDLSDYLDTCNNGEIREESVIEWLGRKTRVNVPILRYAIHKFGLYPSVYDQATFAAFSELNEPWRAILMCKYPVLMD